MEFSPFRPHHAPPTVRDPGGKRVNAPVNHLIAPFLPVRSAVCRPPCLFIANCCPFVVF